MGQNRLRTSRLRRQNIQMHLTAHKYDEQVKHSLQEDVKFIIKLKGITKRIR